MRVAGLHPCAFAGPLENHADCLITIFPVVQEVAHVSDGPDAVARRSDFHGVGSLCREPFGLRLRLGERGERAMSLRLPARP